MSALPKVQVLPKQPPHALEAEQMVLGGLMVKSDTFPTVFGVMAVEDFYRHDHQAIAAAVRALEAAGKPFDVVTVAEYLRGAGKADDAHYAAELASNCYSTANIEHYAKTVREKSVKRRVIALCAQVGDAAYGRDENVIGMLSDGVEQLLRGAGVRSRKFSEITAETEAWLKTAKERRKAGGLLGVASGLPSLDRTLGGFYGPRVYGLAARPGSGKTALLNQIGMHAATHGRPGLILSLEMTGAELQIRALSAASRRNVSKIFHGHDEDTEAAIEACVKIGDVPLWVDTDTYQLDGIIAQIAAHRHKHGIEWAAIDHVGLIETERFNSRNDQIGHITRRLKKAAKSFGIPLIALFQLSRNSEKENRQPGLHDLRDSGNIEQDLDVAMFLHVEKEVRGQPCKPIQIGVLKNRSGRVGWLDGKFEFDGAVQTFREICDDYRGVDI